MKKSDALTICLYTVRDGIVSPFRSANLYPELEYETSDFEYYYYSNSCEYNFRGCEYKFIVSSNTTPKEVFAHLSFRNIHFMCSLHIGNNKVSDSENKDNVITIIVRNIPGNETLLYIEEIRLFIKRII